MSLSILIFGFITLTKILAVWVDRGTLYYQKNNPEVKIVSRYIDLGAGGGGTEPGDYKIVLKRPITPFFKLETSVDTNAIDKSDWIKEGYK
ncbi:hypothetical protein [Mucilaginibacter aquariorum]|uniref:Uncharacterized protein n=1 Tax=Mucilaginibacter aquariorum TaxID=2967225 RepID=A0ABT1T680_9SPHI|nr:hypothetical protein [Mucilaginibacter aquariorum]MCQ6960137.1 hypothetical protein [Mucilaginibacter aquariorum]